MQLGKAARYCLCHSLLVRHSLCIFAGGPAHVEKRETPQSPTMDGKEQQSSVSTHPKQAENSFQPEAWSPGKS